MLSLPWAQVLSLVGELRPRKLRCTAKTKQNRLSVEIREFHIETPQSQLLSSRPATSSLTSSFPLLLLSPAMSFRVPLSLWPGLWRGSILLIPTSGPGRDGYFEDKHNSPFHLKVSLLITVGKVKQDLNIGKLYKVYKLLTGVAPGFARLT